MNGAKKMTKQDIISILQQLFISLIAILAVIATIYILDLLIGDVHKQVDNAQYGRSVDAEMVLAKEVLCDPPLNCTLSSYPKQQPKILDPSEVLTY